MSITFKWVDINAGPSGFRIYRSTSRMTDGAMPAPLATVAGNVFQYKDETALRNVLYYYRVGTIVNGVEALSPNTPLMFLPDSGPGPQKLLRGNYEVGYYGTFDIDLLINAVDFAAFYGLNWSFVASANLPTKWLKFIYKGKVLFFPDTAGFFINMSLNQIYQAGLMYGTNDTTVYSDVMKTANGIVNQVRPWRKGNWTFVPRCPISRANRALTAQTPANELRGGEVDLLIAPAYINRSLAAEFPNARQVDDITGNISHYFYTGDTYVTGAIVRGTATMDAQSGQNIAVGSASVSYRPILELVF